MVRLLRRHESFVSDTKHNVKQIYVCHMKFVYRIAGERIHPLCISVRQKKAPDNAGAEKAADVSAGQPFVKHMARLAFRTLERPAGLQQHVGADADVRLDLFAQLARKQLALALIKPLALTAQFHTHLNAVQISIAIQMDLIKL
ncbi:hypothetical protein D3C79_866120 [compost metagenome]